MLKTIQKINIAFENLEESYLWVLVISLILIGIIVHYPVIGCVLVTALLVFRIIGKYNRLTQD